jgi:hypothetical protein
MKSMVIVFQEPSGIGREQEVQGRLPSLFWLVGRWYIEPHNP